MPMSNCQCLHLISLCFYILLRYRHLTVYQRNVTNASLASRFAVAQTSLKKNWNTCSAAAYVITAQNSETHPGGFK